MNEVQLTQRSCPQCHCSFYGPPVTSLAVCPTCFTLNQCKGAPHATDPGEDVELVAIRAIATALQTLSTPQRQRVLSFYRDLLQFME